MKFKLAKGHNPDFNALPPRIRHVAVRAFKPAGDKPEDKRATGEARRTVTKYFEYLSTKHYVPITKLVHSFKLGRLMVSPSAEVETTDHAAE